MHFESVNTLSYLATKINNIPITWASKKYSIHYTVLLDSKFETQSSIIESQDSIL